MNPQNTTVKIYSPFWSLGLVFATLIFLQAWYVWDDFKQRSQMDYLKQRSQIEAAQAQLKGLVSQAQTISQTTEAVGRELVALAPSSKEAAKIITEFKIQINKPAEAAK